MLYPRLQRILEEEGPDFQVVQNRWRPLHLLFLQQARVLIHDMERRYKTLDEARPELATLARADRYIKVLTMMRLRLRQAFYTWKANQLVFLEATAGFYAEYGQLLRFLKFDQLRWLLADRVPERQGV